MTICVAIKCKEIGKEGKPSLLFASDTQESSLILKRPVTKIRCILGEKPKEHEDRWGILIASSGDALVIDEALSDIEYFLREKIDPDEERPSVALGVLRKEIGDLAYAAYNKYKKRNVSDPSFELLLGAADEFSTILYIRSDGKNRELDKFGIVGSGRITGGQLLLSEFLRDDMNDFEAAHLAAFIIKIVGHVDLSVGGEPDIYVCCKRTAWIPKDVAFAKILKAIESRWDLIKRAWWRMQEDKTAEGRLKKLVKK